LPSNIPTLRVNKLIVKMYYSGFAAVFVSWFFIATSIALNPWWIGHFTTGALSELGTPSEQVRYPWVYNLGLIITSFFAFIYSTSLAYLSSNKVQVVGSSFFMVSSLFLAMIGIFHGGTYPHVFVSTYFFVQADISIITWGVGLLLKDRNPAILMLLVGLLGPVLSQLIPFTSSAEVEVFGILLIDVWVFIVHFGFYRKRIANNNAYNK
jgi:hypothetical membrane protein